MSIKASSLINLDVYSINEGKQIASIKDIIYDPTSQRVLALLLDYGSLLVDPHVLLIDDIRSFGKDAVMIDSAEDMRSTADVDEVISRIAKDNIYLTKTKIITNEGINLGYVSDIYFNPLTGRVEEFEVQKSVNDITSDKHRIKISDILKSGEDATIVKGIVAEKLKKQIQTTPLLTTNSFFNSLKKMLTNTAEKVKQEFNYYKDTRQDVKEAGIRSDAKKDLKKLWTKVEQPFAHYSHEIARIKKSSTKKLAATQKLPLQFNNQIATLKNEDNKEKQKQDVVGKFLTKNILTKEDKVIGKRGEMITNKLLSQAEREGLLDQILNNNTIQPLYSDL